MSLILDFFKHITDELSIFILSAIPVIELRGAIPLGFLYKYNFIKTFLLAVTGNILPVPFIIIFTKRVVIFLKKFKLTNKFIQKFEDKITKKAQKVKTATQWGLLIFVSIPLPGKGAWTTSFIAAFLGMKVKDAFWPIASGVVIAGIIVTAITYGLFSFIHL